MAGRVEDGPSQGSQPSTPQEEPISKRTPYIKPMPFVPGSYGRPREDTLADFQEALEAPSEDFTPLPPDIMSTIHSKINPT